MINVDSHYVIGHSHLNNEDFAISGVEPVPYMILADGCSSSDYSDIGARMLVMSAKAYLLNQLTAGQVPEAGELGLHVALKAVAAVKAVGTSVSSIDATLIASFVNKKQVYVYMYGDGAVFYRDREGEFDLINVEYSHNAPYYLSYRLDKRRDSHYKSISGKEEKIVTRNSVREMESIYEPTVITIPVEALFSLVIVSDGVSSFINTTNAQVIDTESIVKILGSFRNTNGDFVKRRIKRALKVMSKQGVYNGDDLSMAAMVFK